MLDRFPAVSETFVAHELLELRRQGEEVDIWACRGREPGEPVHVAAAALAKEAQYVPRGLRGAATLAAAAVGALARNPRRALPALWWCARARPLERGALRAFAEGALIASQTRGVDRVHAHFAHHSASVAHVVARLSGSGFSFTGHARDIFEVVPARLLRRKISASRFAAGTTEASAAFLRGLAAPEARDKVLVVRNGIDPRLFDVAPRRNGGPPLVLTVARLVPKKGIDVVVDAARVLASRDVPFRWEVIGDGPLRNRLESHVRSAGLAGRLRFSLARDDDYVRSRYAEATVFVLPCRETPTGDRDALPVAIAEAMAAGVPVVSTPVAGVPELVADGVSGRLVPPDDPVATATAVEAVLADPDLRERLATGARTAAAAHNLEACVRRLRRAFEAT